MSITPQAIKDQEFQVKFRGYDSIEVKAYLELLAEEFFELHELRRNQEEEYAELYEENQALKQERDVLLQESRERDARSEESVKEFQEKDDIIAGLEKKVDELEQKVESSEQEKSIQQEAWEKQETGLREEIDMLKELLEEKQETDSESSGEAEKLRAHVELLEGQIAELKQEEVDFKTTLVAAQKFAEDVREKAQAEAEKLVEQAHEEVEAFRREAEEELSSLPVEIEKLKQKKVQVRDELKSVLSAYLEQIDAVHELAGPDHEEDLSDLFQSIELKNEDINKADLGELEVD